MGETFTHTEHAYEKTFSWTATYTAGRGNRMHITCVHNGSGKTTTSFKVNADRQSIEWAVGAGIMHHNTPAYIAARKVLTLIELWPETPWFTTPSDF